MPAIDMKKIYSNRHYKGNWVAMIDFETRPKVVAIGKSLKEAMYKAAQKGYELPLMMKIPKKVLPFVGSPQLIQ